MKTLGEWLRVSVHVQNIVPRMQLLTREESEIGSCRNSTSRFNDMENYGDQMVTMGRGRDFLRSLCEDAGWSADLGPRLAHAIVSNVEFGPIFASGLDLLRFFSANGVLLRLHPRSAEELSCEQIAGVLECILGALEMKGLERLANAILRWCAAAVLLWGHGHEIFDFMPCDCSPAMRHSWEWRVRDHFELRLWIQRHSTSAKESLFVNTLHSWAEASLQEAFSIEPSQQMGIGASQPGQSRRVPAQRRTEVTFDSRTGLSCLGLVCHDCRQEASTSWHAWPNDCYQEAMEIMRWVKPSTRSWAHSRCPDCAMAGGW